jgi:dUTP pyrophosphatase
MNIKQLKVKRLHPDAIIPTYAHATDSGFDLHAIEDIIIQPGETKLIRTGLAVELPPGYELQVRPRSGISLRTKLRVVLGTVDNGFRGEIGVIVDNICGIDDVGYEYVYGYLNGNFSKSLDGEEYEPYYGTPNVLFNVRYVIRKGEKIAQAVIKPVEQAYFIEVDKLEETERGSGGFGSTGTR